MTIFILEQIKPGLRGEITRWMLEIHAGVFVGSLSSRVRDILWQRISEFVLNWEAAEDLPKGAWMIHDAPTEQGFKLQCVGETRRELRDFDGLRLLSVPK